ncbi:MAG: histidine kinase [Cyclobacteriaceae bacterium]
MPKFFIHNPFFRLGAAPVFGVLVYLLIILINNTVEQLSEIFNNQELYVCIALSYIAFESMRLVIWTSNKKLSSEQSIQTRLIYQIILTLLVSLTLVGLSISAYFRWIIGFSIGSSELNLFLIVYGAGGLLYNILFFSQVFLFIENKMKIDEERALRDNLESEFISFKNEVNPDLLYESLESLIITLHKSVDQADELIDNLAGIYRYSIVNRNRELIPLNEELQAVNYLVTILNAKYQDQIKLNLQINEEDIHLIPGSLVVSIDHVVRNTLIAQQVPLDIKCYIEDGYLVMNHTINDRLVTQEDSQQSFEKLQRSYSFFSEKPFVQVKANRENYIKFPLVRVTTEQPIDVNI